MAGKRDEVVDAVAVLLAHDCDDQPPCSAVIAILAEIDTLPYPHVQAPFGDRYRQAYAAQHRLGVGRHVVGSLKGVLVVRAILGSESVKDGLHADFSLYMDMPMPMKIWNTYRSRQIGAYYQSKGIIVIPTISWAEPDTYEFCFQGIPKGSVVSVSTIGVKRDKDALSIWNNGMKEMIRQIEPSAILVYGGKLDFDYGDIDVRYYENKVTESWS